MGKRISIETDEQVAPVNKVESDQNTVSFRQTDLEKTQAYLIKAKPKPDRQTIKPQITNLVVEPRDQSGKQTRPMAQKKSSLASLGPFAEKAYRTNAVLPMPSFD